MNSIRVASPERPQVSIGDKITLSDGTPVRRFKRYALQLGQTYTRPGWREPFKPDHARAKTWLSNFDEMKTNGQPVKATKDHEDREKAESILGDVVGMAIEGDWLTVTTDVRGEKNIAIAEANKDVSVEIEPLVRSGDGREYRDVIAAITYTPVPVVTAQPIAASMADDRFHLSMEIDMKPLFDAIANLSGETATDEVSALAAVAKIQASLDTAKAEVVKLSMKPEADKRYLSMAGKFGEQALQHAVEVGKITADVSGKLKALFIGDRTEGNYSKLMLSMGEDSTEMLDKVLAIISENKPVATGGATKLQLSVRDIPDGGTPGQNKGMKIIKNPYTGQEVEVPIAV